MPPADKARFFLEQAVPELHDLQRKQIFSSAEIYAIIRKRSDFEHVINARGCTSADFARYAEYEMNVATLISKRSKRRGVKNPMGHLGQRRVFFVLDRGVRRFPGDLRLWMQYLSFARDQKSWKKVEQILARVLRMHPTKRELWVYAASFVMDTESDVGKARGYMQRGLRFCTRERDMWLEYARLEMIYVAKISMRRKILGLDSTERPVNGAGVYEDEEDEDMMRLPSVTAEDINPPGEREGNEIDETALANLANTPALTGAIPRAIFDSAMKEFHNEVDLAERFFDLFAEFPQAKCSRGLLHHVLETIATASSHPASAAICKARLSTFGISPSSVEFPSALRSGLGMVREAIEQLNGQPKQTLLQKAVKWLLPFATAADMDEDVQRVVIESAKRFLRMMDGTTAEHEVYATGLITQLQAEGRTAEADLLLDIASSVWLNSDQLRAIASDVALIVDPTPG